jgi:hypothetical protein
MENQMESANGMKLKSSGMSKFAGAWTSFQKIVSGRATSTSTTASSVPTKLFCEKWHPAGIAMLLKDKDQWTALGCQRS